MKNLFSKSSLILAVATLLLITIYGGFEYHTLQNNPYAKDPIELIGESLDTSENLFRQINKEFEQNTHRLTDQIRSRLQSSVSRQAIYNELNAFPFWGSSVYRNGDLFTWHGFTVHNPVTQDVAPDSLHVDIVRRNNVIYMLGKITFAIGDEDQFTLITSHRLQQANVIPIASEQEYQLSGHPSLQNRFPVHFNFFDPVSGPLDHYRVLKTSDSDSAGIVYALRSDMEIYTENAIATYSRWRTIFHITFFILGALIFFFWSYYLRSWPGLVLQLLVILTTWIFFAGSTIPVQWLPQFFPDYEGEQLASMHAISYYALHSIFTFFISFSVITTLTRKWRFSSPEKHYQTFFYSFLLGGFSLILILFFLITTYDTGAIANIALLDLELIPDMASWILFISTGFFLSAIVALLIAVWWVLFISEKDKTAVIGIVATVSFFLFYFLAEQLLSFSLFKGWIILLSFGIFAASIGSAAYVYKFPESFLQMSGFRLLLLVALLSSAAGYTIYANAYSERMDEQLVATATEFATEEDESARNVAFNLLSSIELHLSMLATEDLQEERSTVQTQFQRAIQLSMHEDWRRYSYDIQLLNSQGELISDYATNFDSPGTGFFDLVRLQTSYQQEQIRQETNRPVVQSRPASLAEDEFTTLYRGWIPIYGNDTAGNIIAWVVAVVYIERPNYNKPIRAVLAASTIDDWKTSYYLAEFHNGRLHKNTVKGLYANQPKYNQLSDREMTIAEEDSIAYILSLTAQGTFRELIFKKSEESIIKASTPVPGFNNHIFSFFRFNVVIIIAGLILFPLFSLLGLKTFSLFSQSRKFQNRLLDGLALATLLFLVVLIIATQHAVNHQNETNLQREIITKLDTLADTIRFEQQQQLFENRTGFIPLSRATSPLDADAIFYRTTTVTESTTPQIFQQNLLPMTIPYPVYDFLYNRQSNHVVRTIDIGNETLMIGYRVIHSEENEPIGVAAIPTFPQSPVYTAQLLETTSYLLTIYLVIFGVFIIGTVLISSRLTRPLQYIQEGLNKISGGDLETTIAVKSRDEIGSLSNAYNIMVKKLKVLQTNLAKVEREAAWKEMAQQVAHEIKNPLTPMKLNLQHLQRQLKTKPENPEEFRKNIERVTINIIEQIESLNKIASDFSKFARPIREEFTEVDVNELIRSVVEFYKPEERGTITHDLHPGPLHIMGSNDELRRTLINLVKNSYEAVDHEAKLIIRSTKSSGKVIIEVEDNGSGITAEDHDKIFVPNFSTKSSGTGLGLAITKKIIEAHDGEISFHSELEKGTTFKIVLPLNGIGNTASAIPDSA